MTILFSYRYFLLDVMFSIPKHEFALVYFVKLHVLVYKNLYCFDLIITYILSADFTFKHMVMFVLIFV